MERYELERRYEEDDEIDLVELLKTIIRERKMVIAITIFCIILSGAFAFYKNNKPHNYGVDISFSEETVNKIKQYNTTYKNAYIDLNQSIQNSFNELINEKNSEIITLSSENIKEINEILKKEYNYIKIIDKKNKTYKLFTKIKNNKDELEKVSKKITQIIDEDTKFLNSEFDKNISISLATKKEELENLTAETKKLNKDIMNVIKENFKNVSEENIHSNLSIISPILYVEYQEKINSLNSVYLKVVDLKEIKNNSKELFELSGENNINLIKLDNTSENSGISNKLILVIGAVLGLFAGMFIAIIKAPLKNIFKEIKEENK